MSAAPARDPARLHSAGKIIAIGRVQGLPLQPTMPTKPDASARTARRVALWREDQNRPSQAENAFGRKRPKIARVIGTTEIRMEKNGIKRDLPTGESG